LKKKIEQELGVIFKIVMHIKMLFYDNRKKIYAFPPPPLPNGLSRKNFLGHLKKNIVQRNVAEKKILASNWGIKKNSCTEKLPNPPSNI
jgi:hypothetical protein